MKRHVLILSLTLLACVPLAPVPESPTKSVSKPVSESSRISLELKLSGLHADTEQTGRVLLRDGAQVLEPTVQVDGKFVFQEIERERSYELLIDLPTFLGIHKYLYFEANAPDSIRIQIALEPIVQTFQGKIFDALQQMIPRALVRCGDAYTESDSQGVFLLALGKNAVQSCQIFRQGYHSLSVAPNEQKDFKLEPVKKTPRLLLVDDLLPLGLKALDWNNKISSLRRDTESQGWEVLSWSDLEPDPIRDLLWLASPQQSLGKTRQNKILNFVAQGGKLVVTSEWAGFKGLDLGPLNELLLSLGLELGADTLFQDKLVSASEFRSHYLTQGLRELRLFRTASVMTYHPDKASLLGWAKPEHYRILASSRQSILAAGYYGLGRFIVLGDTSLWLDTAAAETSYYQSADNALLWQHILGW